MAQAAGFPVMVDYGRPRFAFRNIKTLMGGIGFSDG